MARIKEKQGSITHVYKELIHGFSAVAPDDVMQQLAKLDGVTVEADQVISVN